MSKFSYVPSSETPRISSPLSLTTPVADALPSFSIPPAKLDSGTTANQKYNELNYKVQLYLDNSGNFQNSGSTNRYNINPSAVLDLSIVDTVNDWIADGSITIMYLPEDVDPKQYSSSGQPTPTAIGARENAQTLKSYQFRADGFDLLRVMMVPVTNSESEIQVNENDTKWVLSYLFSIFDVEDVTPVIPNLAGHLSTYMKCIKMRFHDVRYQILKTTNLEYSTALSPEAVVDPSLANGYNGEGQPGRVLPTGVAMLEVFNKALDGTTLDGGSGDPIFAVQRDEHWDEGKANIFYTSPANWHADDDIQYLLAQHVSKTATLANGADDLCVLHTDRPPSINDLEPIRLTPLSEFFKKAGSGENSPGELQLEHFFVTAQTNARKSPSRGSHKAPMGGASSDRDIKTSKYGQILSYSFVDMAAEINSSMFVTKPVYSVDFATRTFNIEFKNNDVESARQSIGKSYIDKLYKQGNGENLFLTTLHNSKKSVNVFPTFSLNGDNKIARQRNGILDLIYTGLFQNACICFKTYGLTLRQSGTFIGIDRIDGADDNDYNNKLYGQWFVVKVDHQFEAGLYMNVIWAVKLHRFKDPNIKFGKVY